MRALWRIMRTVAAAVAIGWAIIALLHGIALLESNPTYFWLHVYSIAGSSYRALDIWSLLFILLSAPYTLAVALFALIEALLTRRWMWSVIPAFGAVGCIALGYFLGYGPYLDGELENIYGWAPADAIYAKVLIFTLIFALGAVLEALVAFLLWRKINRGVVS